MKRRSSSSRPLDAVFFADRSVGRRLPELLREAGFSVEVHDDHFDQDTPDEVWLEECGKRDWVAITRDTRIRRRDHETESLMTHRARCLVLVGKVKTAELAENFIAGKAKIERFLRRHEAPFIAKIYRNPPRVEMWLSGEDWEPSSD